MFILLVFFVFGADCKACFGPGIFNSDGSGSFVATNVPFSTSQNFGFSSDLSIARWQTTHWSFPARSGTYPTLRRDTYIDAGRGFVYIAVNGTCSRSLIVTPGLSLSCVPSSWSNWIGTCGEQNCDTFSIGTVNVTTVVPPDQVKLFLPDQSVLADASGQITQLRVRENGHYRLLLSIENVGPLTEDFSLRLPASCTQPTPGKDILETTLFPPFWQKDYYAAPLK